MPSQNHTSVKYAKRTTLAADANGATASNEESSPETANRVTPTRMSAGTRNGGRDPPTASPTRAAQRAAKKSQSDRVRPSRGRIEVRPIVSIPP